MLKSIRKGLVTLFFFTLLIYVKASHVPGGNISYENVGPNTFVITLTVFEDCGTAFISNASEPISVSNDCGIPFQSTIQLPNVVFQDEVSQLCVTSLPLSECNGGHYQVYTCTYGKIPLRYQERVIAGHLHLKIVVEIVLTI